MFCAWTTLCTQLDRGLGPIWRTAWRRGLQTACSLLRKEAGLWFGDEVGLIDVPEV